MNFRIKKPIKYIFISEFSLIATLEITRIFKKGWVTKIEFPADGI